MAKPTNRGGRPSIFGSKDGGERIQGVLTPVGSVRFNQARQRLAKIAGWEPEDVSDADTAEFLARGEAATIKLLRK